MAKAKMAFSASLLLGAPYQNLVAESERVKLYMQDRGHRLSQGSLKPLGHVQLHGIRKVASEDAEGAGGSYCRAILYHL